MQIVPRKAGLPAIRYTTFIEAFEKAVSEHQKIIAELESGQAEYLACQEAIAKVALPNDGELKLAFGGPEINIVATKDDCRATFDAVAAAVGAALVDRELHPDGLPAVRTETLWYPEITYHWRTNRTGKSGVQDIGIVKMQVKIPDAGIRDLMVETVLVPTVNAHYRLVPRDVTLPRVDPPEGAHVHVDIDLPF